MSKTDNLHDFLVDIADAVREKKGTTAPINAQNLSEEIMRIQSGGDNPWRADVTWLRDGEFGFNSMSEVEIHEGVTVIGDKAFRYNESITKLTFPSTLKEIKQYGCSGMTKLSEANLPAGLTTLGNYAFNGSPIEESIIPEGVVRVGYGAYTGCKQLVRVLWYARKRKDQVTPLSIGGIAFQDCSALQYVSFPNAEEIITLDATNAFNGTTCQIVVPDNLYGEWKAADNWKVYENRIVSETMWNEQNQQS